MPVPLATQPGPISPLTLEVRNAGVPLSLRDPKEVVVRFDVSGHTFMRFTAGELAQAGGAVTKTLVPDVLPPPAVPAFTAKRTAAATAVSWSPVKDPAVAGALSSGIMGYKVIRQTNPLIQVGSVGPADTSFVDSPFMPGAVYYVLAYDSAGNNSLSSWTFVDGDYTKWSKSTAITLNTRPSGADVAQDVAEFPLLVTLDAHNFPFGEARADGGDLRFSTPEGEPLSYEIETYSRDAQRAEIWVLTPLVQGDAQREAIVMHWGNEYATDQSTHDAVFARSNGFVAVWHMAPPRPPCGPEAKRPWCNYGHALRCAHDGLDSVIDLWDQQQGDRLSVSMFHALYRQLTDKGNTGHAAVEPCAQCRHGQHAARYAQFTLSWWARAAGTWHFYAFVCDRGRELFYVDGKQAGRSQFRCVASDEIDEIWISSVARSPAWIRLCWENRRDGQRLVVLGPAEAGSAGCLPVSAQVHVHRPRDR